mmetsp:Transcript_37952/g.117291  ORF Transcript_37952/g.117291 Transcript_37952/m.117291 type:complete len:440 (+) Transcript_37952:146-1465(+)
MTARGGATTPALCGNDRVDKQRLGRSSLPRAPALGGSGGGSAGLRGEGLGQHLFLAQHLAHVAQRLAHLPDLALLPRQHGVGLGDVPVDVVRAVEVLDRDDLLLRHPHLGVDVRAVPQQHLLLRLADAFYEMHVHRLGLLGARVEIALRARRDGRERVHLVVVVVGVVDLVEFIKVLLDDLVHRGVGVRRRPPDARVGVGVDVAVVTLGASEVVDPLRLLHRPPRRLRLGLRRLRRSSRRRRCSCWGATTTTTSRVNADAGRHGGKVSGRLRPRRRLADAVAVLRLRIGDALAHHRDLRAAEVLHALRVAQGVEAVLAVRARPADRRDHRRARIPEEGVAQHLGEDGPAEGDVCLVLPEGADALLQREQRLVDLGALHARLAVAVEGVGAALVSGKVDEGDAADGLLRRVLAHLQLQHGVAARRLGVRARLPRGAALGA